METLELTLNIPKGQHYKSTDIAYTGGFTRLSKCKDCEAIQDHWSNSSRICEYCGGQLIEFKIGKWSPELKQWICRE